MNFWDFCAPIYDIAEKTNGKAYDGMIKAIANLVSVGDMVLECAAGTGSVSIGCADKAKQVLCTDMSSNMLKVARLKAKKKNISNISFSECDIYNIDQLDNSYEVVIASQVLHLLDNPEKAAEELKRVSSKLVVVPLTLLENIKLFERVKVKIWKILGFSPKHNFGAESYKKFLCDIGLSPNNYTIVDGKMPMAVAVWSKM